ncbi:expressed protein, partial [Phakopsora pachyrhizi]
MIFYHLLEILCFISAAESMNIGYRDHLFGEGKNVQNELSVIAETSHLCDSALRTSKSNAQKSALDSDMIPEHSTGFSTEHTYLDKISFPKPIAPEISTLESNVQYNGELICRNTRVGGRPRFFGEIDNSNLKKYENLIDGSAFQVSSLGNNFMVADDHSVLSEFHTPQNYESLARFKKRRLHDVLPERPFDQISKVSNPLYQTNEGLFNNHANLPEGLTPFSNPYTYPQPNPEIHSISQEEWLAQSHPIYDDVSIPHARYSTGQKLKSPSAYSEDNDFNYDPFSESEFWASNLQPATPDLDAILDKLSCIQSRHNFYSNINCLPVAKTEFYKSVSNTISDNNFETLLQNNPLNYEKSIITDNLANHSFNYQLSLLENKLHTSGSRKESMIENHIVDYPNDNILISDKAGTHHEIHTTNILGDKSGSSNRFETSSGNFYPLFLSSSKFQKEEKAIINQFDQSKKARDLFQKEAKLNEAHPRNNQFNYTPIGGLIDYKLNLYHIHCLSKFKSSEFLFPLEEIKKKLLKPSFSNILIAKHLEYKKRDRNTKIGQDFLVAKPFGYPINKINLEHFKDHSFKFCSQLELNEFMDFFEKDPRLAALQKETTTIDDYFNSIFKKLSLGNSKKQRMLEIIKAHEEIKPKSAKEEVFRNFSFFRKIIVSPYLTKSFKPIIPLKSNDNKTIRFLNEISTKSGLKRIKCLSLRDEMVKKTLNYLKKHFDGRLRKNNISQYGWCEIAIRTILSASNRIILFYRIFTTFDEFCIENLQENLKYFTIYAKYFFLNLFEYFVAKQNKLISKDPHLLPEEKDAYFIFYMNSEKVRFEYDCSKYLFENWLNYNPKLEGLI